MIFSMLLCCAIRETSIWLWWRHSTTCVTASLYRHLVGKMSRTYWIDALQVFCCLRCAHEYSVRLIRRHNGCWRDLQHLNWNDFLYTSRCYCELVSVNLTTVNRTNSYSSYSVGIITHSHICLLARDLGYFGLNILTMWITRSTFSLGG